jgi:hypothetical protein
LRSIKKRDESRRKILFICGSLNQTSQMHAVARELPDHDAVFTPYYGDRAFALAKRLGLLESTIGGDKLVRRCLAYLEANELAIEHGGFRDDFDLAVHCSDLVWPENLDRRPVVLVQEGMTDPPSVLYPLVRRFDMLPRWLAGTSAFGLSHRYTRFCVASEGYREHFIARGCDPSKIVVTGIPNFDDCRRYERSDFPFRGFVLCCTSDVREVFWFEDRRALILRAVELAKERGKPLVFKLHPNENHARATREIERWAPHALVYAHGSAEEMVARCDTLLCTYSTLAYVGLALGKEVFSRFDEDELRRLMPLQNGRAASQIASVIREVLREPSAHGPRDVGRAPHASKEVSR